MGGLKYRSPDNKKLYCCYCGRWLVFPLGHTSEHLVPLSKGGNDSNYNKKPCCHTCNSERGNKDLLDWLTENVNRMDESGVDGLILVKRIENIKYWMHYIETAGAKLLKSTDYNGWKRKRSEINSRWPE